VIDVYDTATDARKKRKELKAKRDRLFDKFLKNPSDTLLAFEIKTIDDQIADSTERSSAKRLVRK
jgi:hypothetical protein